MRKYLAVAIIFVAAGIVYLLLALNAGRILISVVEGRTGFDIEYDNLQGDIFHGYRAENLRVKISPTDSLRADAFELRYRLLPLVLSRNSGIEVNLIRPDLKLRPKQDIKPGRQSVMALILNIVLNIQDGRVRYAGGDTLLAENIFGSCRVSTQAQRFNILISDWAFGLPRQGLWVSSLSAAMIVAENRIDFNYLRVNSSGVDFVGSGLYDLDEKLVSLSVESSTVDLSRLGRGVKGQGELVGEVTYQDGKVWGQGQVSVSALQLGTNRPVVIDHAQASFLAREDSIDVTIEQGRSGGASIRGIVKIGLPRSFSCKIVFDSLNLQAFHRDLPPWLVRGDVAYNQSKASGRIMSYTPGLDSARFAVVLRKDRIEIDSLRGYHAGGRILVRGDVFPKLNLFVHTEKYPLVMLRQLTGVEIAGLASGSWSVSGDYRGPAVAGRFRVTDFACAALVKAGLIECEISAAVTNKTIDMLTLRAVALDIGRQSIDSVRFSLKDQALVLDVQADSDRYAAVQGTTEGLFAGRIEVIKGSLDGFEFGNERPIDYDIARRTIGEMVLTVGQGRLVARLDSGRRYLRLEKMRLDQLSKLLRRPKMEGVATLTLDGDKFTAECDSFKLLRVVNYGEVNAYGRLVGPRLVIDSLWVIDLDGAEAWASGTLGLDGIDMRGRGSNLGLGVFAMLDKIFELGQGRVSAEVRVSGPYADLSIDGRARFEQADLKLIVTESPLRNASGDLVFEGKRIVIENAGGACGDGWARTQGYVQLAPKFKMTDLELRVVFEDCLGSFRPIAYGVGSGKIMVLCHKNLTSYEGDVRVKEAILPLGFGTTILRKKPQGKEAPWKMKIKFIGDKNVWLKNDMADVEMSGEIFLMKTDGEVYLSGDLASRRGRVYYLDHTLTVTEGKVVFTSDPEFNPTLDIRSEMVARGNVTIIFHIAGTLRYPIFEFFTDNAEWSEQDIITYLNLNMTWQELQEYQRRDVVGNVLPRRVFEYIEAGASRRLRRMTGLDYFDFETPIFSTGNQAKVTVGKYVFPNLFITYTHDVFSFAQDAFTVEYMLNNRNELLIKRTSDNIYSLEYQFRIRY